MFKCLRFRILPQTKILEGTLPLKSFFFKLSMKAESTIPVRARFCKVGQREDTAFCARAELVCLLWGRPTHQLFCGISTCERHTRCHLMLHQPLCSWQLFTTISIHCISFHKTMHTWCLDLRELMEGLKPYKRMITCHLPRFQTFQSLPKTNSFITKVAESLCFFFWHSFHFQFKTFWSGCSFLYSSS